VRGIKRVGGPLGESRMEWGPEEIKLRDGRGWSGRRNQESGELVRENSTKDEETGKIGHFSIQKGSVEKYNRVNSMIAA